MLNGNRYKYAQRAMNILIKVNKKHIFLINTSYFYVLQNDA